MYTCVSRLGHVATETDRQIPVLISYHSGGTHHAGQIWQNSTYTSAIFDCSRQSNPSYVESECKLAKTACPLADKVADQATFHEGFIGDGGDEASQEVVDHSESVCYLPHPLDLADKIGRRSSKAKRKSSKTTKSG